MTDEIGRPGVTFVTELRAGETWAYLEGVGIVFARPGQPPVIIGDPAIEGTLDLGDRLTYEFIGENMPRTIFVRRERL